MGRPGRPALGIRIGDGVNRLTERSVRSLRHGLLEVAETLRELSHSGCVQFLIAEEQHMPPSEQGRQPIPMRIDSRFVPDIQT